MSEQRRADANSSCPAPTPSHTLPVFGKCPLYTNDNPDRNAGHAAQRRRTCDQLSLSTALYRLKRQPPPPDGNDSGGRGGFAVRDRRRIATTKQSTCCRNPRVGIGVTAQMIRRCLAPGRALESERRWLGKKASAARQGKCGKDFLLGEKIYTSIQTRLSENERGR